MCVGTRSIWELYIFARFCYKLKTAKTIVYFLNYIKLKLDSSLYFAFIIKCVPDIVFKIFEEFLKLKYFQNLNVG